MSKVDEAMSVLRSARERYKHESETRGVKVPEYVTVTYEPLDKVPDIKLQFIVGGGPFMTFDYRVVGGPDDGKRVCLVPWRAEWTLTDAHEKYNGSKEEFDGCMGYPARPGIYSCVTLHIATVMYIVGMLRECREHDMSGEISRLMDKLYEASAEAA